MTDTIFSEREELVDDHSSCAYTRYAAPSDRSTHSCLIDRFRAFAPR